MASDENSGENSGEYFGIDDDVAEVRRRVDALLVDLKGFDGDLTSASPAPM